MNAHICIDFGWYSLNVASGPASDLEIIKSRPTGFGPRQSVQSTWILAQLELLGNKQSVIARTAMLVDPYTPKTVK